MKDSTTEALNRIRNDMEARDGSKHTGVVHYVVAFNQGGVRNVSAQQPQEVPMK